MKRTSSTSKFFCVVAGRSGGHILPAITYAQEYAKQSYANKILFFSANTSLDRSIVSLYPDINLHVKLHLDNFPGKKLYKYPQFICQLLYSTIKSIYKLYIQKPSEIISMGGYISLPVCIAAKILRIPVKIFELNSTPGRAVKLLAPFASRIYTCFEQAQKFFPAKKTQMAPYPLRFNNSHKISKAQARKQLKLDIESKIILILGGSQGSRFINNLMINFAKYYKNSGNIFTIVHQTGSQSLEQIKEQYLEQNINAQVFDYTENLAPYYCAADIVIARAGAGTLFELKFFEKQAIIIPLETDATDHQLDNANAMSQTNSELFKVFRQEQVERDSSFFFEVVSEALSERQ